MISIDTRFDKATMETLKSKLGKRLVKFKCNPFIFSASIYSIIGIIFEDSTFAFTNTIEATDYFGTKEDVAIFRLEKMPEEKITSRIIDLDMINVEVNNTLSEISVINEHQKLFKKAQQTYDVWLTRGIIFKFVDGYELSFEKDIWFSEMIIVRKGYDLLSQFSSVNEFIDDWSGDIKGDCSRQEIILQHSSLTV